MSAAVLPGLPSSPTVEIKDEREAPQRWYAERVRSMVNDPRDIPFIGLMTQCSIFAVIGVGMFWSGPWLWRLAPIYWLGLIFGLLDRFTLMLHCTSHRPLFNPRFRRMNQIIPWMLCPFFGQTPETYFAHHMGMHHNEENLEEDLSSTLKFQRDRFTHWLRYYGRFLFVGLPDLLVYMRRKGRDRLARSIIRGEGLYWGSMACLALWKPGAVLVVFIVPLLIIRTLMMMGNWGQHAFVAARAPESPYLSSITCINSRYNRRCFNDGYHIGHHLKARAHWTELPVEFESNIAEYGKQDAIVFEGIDFFLVWLLLMTGQWSALARRFVHLPGAPVRTQAEIIEFLKERVRPIAA
jgi:fatty acid desaturase